MFKDNHPNIASSLDNFAGFYKSMGHYDIALEFHDKSLTMRKAIYKGNHSHVAASLNNLAIIYL